MAQTDELPFHSLPAASAWYRRWLAERALPLWSSVGVDAANGAFQEALDVEGRPVAKPRRARVQARQSFVYAETARHGFGPPLLDVARRGFAFYRAHYRLPDGRYAALADADGRVLDETPFLYEQAFSLLALAGLHAAGSTDFDHAADAAELLDGLSAVRHPAGGFRELTDHPFQANAHMHLLEAAFAWEEQGVSPRWTALTDEIVELCLARFIDPARGALHEFFDADWRLAAGDDGRLVEPGHQFEWAWLLQRWSRARGDDRGARAARRLFENGLAGIDRARSVAVNELWDDLSMRDPMARLWPQTEYLKAALILDEPAEALTAANGLAKYLTAAVPGAWRDKLRPDGGFVQEPAPATSFYHLWMAIAELLASA